MLKTILLDGKSVEYEFERKRVRNINLRIRHDGSVYVSCPRYIAVKDVEDFLRSKSDFIFQGIRKMADRIDKAARPVDYSDNEGVNVFGERCTLRVMSSDKNRVVFSWPEVFLYVTDVSDAELRRKTYEKWRRKILKNKILEMCEFYFPHFEKAGVSRPSEIKFRQMSSKWGVCDVRKKTITFNYNLFEVPEESIAYVVVHEYAHLIEPNHSHRFYAQVGRVLPDYKARISQLKEY